jgi:predicted dehydrogenase
MSSKSRILVTSRRGFLKTAAAGSGGIAGLLSGCATNEKTKTAVATTTALTAANAAHAAHTDTIQIALVGCGGRGGGAAGNAMSAKNGPVKLVAMADVFEDRLKASFEGLKNEYADKMDVPAERKFIGFDGYKHAMDALKPGDVVILTTPLAFRWVHFTYAISKGLNVFMEKPLIADGPTAKRMYALAEQASAKNLKVGVGLMSRHSKSLIELHDRIQNGEIGDIILMRGYRMHGPVGSAFSTPKPPGENELLWQIRRFHSFLWASGGCFSDFYIHHIDHCCWMKNAWPVKAQGVGGRHFRGNNVDQNFDSYGVEYTFPDNTKLLLDGRCMFGAVPMYHSFAHGTKGSAVIAKANDCDGPSSTYSSQAPARDKLIWQSRDKSDPYVNEWEELLSAIREDRPYNEVKRGVDASVATSMGRMAAHTAQEITWDDFLNSDHEFSPNTDKFTFDSAAPLVADATTGLYPVPSPGLKPHREY